MSIISIGGAASLLNHGNVADIEGTNNLNRSDFFDNKDNLQHQTESNDLEGETSLHLLEEVGKQEEKPSLDSDAIFCGTNIEGEHKTNCFPLSQTDQETHVPISEEIRKIASAYEEFIDSGSLSPTNLNASTSCLNNLEKVHRNLWNSGKEEDALNLSISLEECRKRVQEMNFQSPILTPYDVIGIASFFTPPVEKTYIDKRTQIKYVRPDHSSLLQKARDFFIPEFHDGVGLSREQCLKNPDTNEMQNCDIVYITKDKDLIAYELGKMSIFAKFLNLLCPMKTRLESLKKVFDHAFVDFNKESQNWGYDSPIHFCGTEELMNKFKYSRERAVQTYCVILFHKQCKV